MGALGSGSATAAPEPGFFRVAADGEAPFPVRWLDAAEREVMVSDLAGGLAAIRLDSGLVAWTRALEVAPGPSPRRAAGDTPMVVAAVGGLVVASGHQLAVFRRSVGTRVWDRGLRCGGGACRERVVHVDDSGVYLAGGGEVQHALLRLDLQTGAPMWEQPAAVNHPQRVLANVDTLALSEGLPPFAVRFVAKDTGRERGAWVRRVAGVPRPATDLWLTRRGLTAVDLRPADGQLAHVFTTDLTGREAADVAFPRPRDLRQAPIFALVTQHRFVAFAPDPAAGTGRLLLHDLIGDAPPVDLRISTWVVPLEVAGVLVFQRRSGEVVTVEGVDPMTGRRLWERDLGGFMGAAAPAELHGFSVVAPTGGGLIVMVGQGDPVALWALEPRTGSVVGYRALALGGATVTAVGVEPGGLVVAVGERVLRLVLEPGERAEAAFDEHFGAGRADDARGLAQALAPLAPHAPRIRRLLERGASARLATAEARLAAGDLVGGFEAIGGALDEALAPGGAGGAARSARDVAGGLVTLLAPVARLVGDAVLASARPLRRDARDALVGVAARLTRGLIRVHAALGEGGAVAANQDLVRRAVVVLAVALDRVGEPLAAADLVETVLAAGYRRVPAVEELYAGVAFRALELVHRDLSRPLVKGRADQRAEVARGLEHFRHGYPIFGDAAYLSRLAESLTDPSEGHARAAAREADRALRGRIAELRREIGDGFAEPACALACESLAASCEDGCRSAVACEAAAARCRAACASARGVPRWTPPAEKCPR